MPCNSRHQLLNAFLRVAPRYQHSTIAVISSLVPDIGLVDQREGDNIHSLSFATL